MQHDLPSKRPGQVAKNRASRQKRDLILIVVPKLGIGGTEHHLLAVLPRLIGRGFDIELLALRGKGRLDEEMRARGVPMAAAPRLLPGRANALVGCLHLLYRIVRAKPRVVHYFLPEAYIVGGMICLWAGSRRHIMSRRSLNEYQRNKPFSRDLEGWLHRRMTAVVGNSRAVLRQLAEERAPRDRLALIHNGVEVGRFAGQDRAAARRSLGLAPDALVLSIVATLLPYKGHADLLTALSLVKDRLPERWRLLVAGRDEGIGGSLRAQAERLGIAAHTVWLGESGAVPAVLAASDIGLLASHQEGFPNAILEGMAAGLPIVATDAGGCREAVQDGVTGRLVPPQTPAALAEAIAELAGDPDKRTAMGRAGQAKVAADFSIDACVDAYEQLYDAVLAGRALPAGNAGALASDDPGAAGPSGANRIGA